MGKRDKQEEKKNNKNLKNEKVKKEEKPKNSLLSNWVKRWIKATLMFLLTIIVVLSFPYFNKAGYAGQVFINICNFLFGKAYYSIPLFLFVSGLIFLKTRKKGKDLAMILAIIVSIVGVSGLMAVRALGSEQCKWFCTENNIGFRLAQLFSGLFGTLVANIIFGVILLVSLFIFLQFVWNDGPKEEKDDPRGALKPSFGALNKREEDNLKIKGIEQEREKEVKAKTANASKISLFKKGGMEDQPERKEISKKPASANKNNYILPSLDLLNKNEAAPTSGNIKENSVIIKSTLENFGIPVEMAEVNIGPTVTQYAFKPAEGVKLSKITTLSNNLALALAAHPIRIEAPIPGKSLVGIEVPNKVRSVVTLRNLMSNPNWTSSTSPLLIALGRNVAGAPVYTDITEGPHVLVAGATGTGKTIFLNTLILSLLYRYSPEQLRMIMVDPKRVEFQNYNEIPHLLCPVIYDAHKTINALQWLTREMERRFEVFSEIPTRNLATYNSNKTVIANGAQLPYIVFVVDELADLMAAKGRELEAGIVRLAQMARATGIHLVLATQRPSVEVITGLIKANVPTRITFQVSSQVDSRTVIDTSGAEKLLGAGDMLFSSAKSAKISRIQGPYISEKEVNKVASFIAEQKDKFEEPQATLVQNLQAALETPDPKEAKESNGDSGELFGGDDPLFDEVKKIVLETRKASASYLQRRLRIGYSRAARLIDMLEEKGIVGAADGAKPREVFGDIGDATKANLIPMGGLDESEDGSVEREDNWKKV